ncbi:MAG: HAD-IIIA family hydrolase [Rhodospirillaceae bacterium]|nr:HAD-IIIA family hydrolase [Rhodospirillaceae bacterium]MBT4489638.1 HAD-IIIA family hydrolase [Rhodospirillaceae bacterium]MBT5192668.1 HAD-IIIA family hydrolase [Rhodospirillaceae bacterium]MBT5896463.1 HAD-IIIA family hydrolase [Rhodospirillaceae bacterium]MBT6430718.1 HAD-IIIA family hydrolase [Rhodospirillaceae bacterium]
MTTTPATKRDWAAFLDRDGVINSDVYDPDYDEWGSPHRVEDFQLRDGVLEALKTLQGLGPRMILVSNQPSYAKGKTSLENIHAVAAHFESLLENAGIQFTEFCYAYGHPNAVVPGYGPPHIGRKPSPYFLQRAARENDIELTASWMVGDRDSDILCGRSAGTRTIQVENPHAGAKSGHENPDFIVANLSQAVEIIRTS